MFQKLKEAGITIESWRIAQSRMLDNEKNAHATRYLGRQNQQLTDTYPPETKNYGLWLAYTRAYERVRQA